MKENEIASIVVDLCYHIHLEYGPGLFESVYEEILCYELRKLEFAIKRQCYIPLTHEGVFVPRAFKADLIIEDKVLIELKSVDDLSKLHYKQVFTYLKLTGCRLGLLVNFNVGLMKEGIHRIVNKL
ncbi:MAG TPA: GxxExxY protein [Flavisolibacter sp.]|jgi:GxxExxY protein